MRGVTCRRDVNLPISSAELRWRAAEPFPAPSQCVQPSESFCKSKVKTFSTLSFQHHHENFDFSTTAYKWVHLQDCGSVWLSFCWKTATLCPFWDACLEVSLSYLQLMSGLVISIFSPHHILHVCVPSRTGSVRACLRSAGISGSTIKLLRSDRSAA